MAKLHAIVKGKVQGVWYRAWTRDLAVSMKISGWVRNRVDGSVETEAYAGRDLLETFLEKLYDGPPLARVAEVETTWSETDEAPVGFSVRG